MADLSQSGKCNFPSASSSMFSFVEEEPSQDQQHHHSLAREEVKCSSAAILEPQGVREMSRQQWEALKPLIQRVYIDENKPFPYLADILRKDHGFEPTKRQFSRKVAEWGFRKNVSRSERRTILKSFPCDTCDGFDKILDFNDPRIKSAKLKSWRKRYRDEVKMVTTAGSQPSRCRAPASGKRLDTNLASQIQSNRAAPLENMVDPFPVERNSDQPLPSYQEEAMDTTLCQLWQDLRPFDWATVDVPGSPSLSRLFNALKIERSITVPPLSLEPLGNSIEVGESPYLTISSIQNLFPNKNKSPADDWNYTPYTTQPNDKDPSGDHSINYSPQYPWRDIGEVFFGYTATPLNEIYVFPHSPSPPFNHFSKSLGSEVTIWGSLEAQEKELETKFSKLKRQFGVEHPGVVAVMENLSDVYYQHNKYKKAERIRRKLVDLHRKLYGTTSLKPLETCRRVIHALLGQGRYSEAQKLHGNLRSTILKRVHPEHKLAVHAMETQALISGALGNSHEEETLHRQTLQLRLASLGPRNKETLFSLTQLASSLAETHSAECRKLLYIAMQLSIESPDPVDGELCWIMRRLSADCWEQNEFEEGYNLARTALERYSVSLGLEHPVTLETQLELAWNLSELGRMAESEEVFRAVVALQSKAACEAHPLGLSGGYSGLARFLMMVGQFEEAISFYETIFQARREAYGSGSPQTINTCYFLGECYENLERYADALQVYRWAIDGIRSSGNDVYQRMPELEAKMVRTESAVAESRRGSMNASSFI